MKKIMLTGAMLAALVGKAQINISDVDSRYKKLVQIKTEERKCMLSGF